MKPLYSTLEVIINSEVGNISSISGEISPNHTEDTVNLADGSITYGSSTNKKSIVFSGLNTSTVTGTPIVFNIPSGESAIFKISSITIDGKTNTDLEYPFKIDARQSYTLNLNIKDTFRITDISYTKMFTMALSTTGEVYIAGNNHRCAMGNTVKENTNITSFQLCTDLHEKSMQFKAILAAGYSTAYAVSKEGRLYVAGYSWLGQLGLGLKNGEIQRVFREVLTEGKTGNSFNVDKIWGGEYHTFIKTTDGKIYVAGAHDNLQAGLGYPVSGGQVTVFTEIEPTLFDYQTVIKITTGERTTMALTDKGNVYYAGRNGASYGSLGGVPDTNMFVKFPTSMHPFDQKIIEIYSGAWHNFVLTESGELWAAGRNSEGQLGINSRSHASKWTRVTLPKEISGISDISAGGFHTYLLSNGKLYSTGLNDTGQLGLADTKLRQEFTPLSIRQPVDAEKLYHGPNNDCRHTYMKGLDGRFYNVGWNAWGQLSNGTTINNVTFQQFYH
ncbi:RCC1 domain-containing protein [Elizabethkingia ursingii]